MDDTVGSDAKNMAVDFGDEHVSGCVDRQSVRHDLDLGRWAPVLGCLELVAPVAGEDRDLTIRCDLLNTLIAGLFV